MKKFLKKIELDTEVVVIAFLIMFVCVFFVARAQLPPFGQTTVTLLGEHTMHVAYGSDFTDPGATAIDPLGNDITNAILVTGSVDTYVSGTYTISYYVTDGEFEASERRTVIVDEEVRPTSSGSTARKRALSLQNNTVVQDKVELDSSVTSAKISESSESFESSSRNKTSKTDKTSNRTYDSNNEESSEINKEVIAEFAEDKPHDKFIFDKNLSVGMNAQDVVELQKRLYTEGFFPDTKLSGQFGVATFNAVLRYQIAHLTEIGASTGFVGPATRAVLNQ